MYNQCSGWSCSCRMVRSFFSSSLRNAIISCSHRHASACSFEYVLVQLDLSLEHDVFKQSLANILTRQTTDVLQQGRSTTLLGFDAHVLPHWLSRRRWWRGSFMLILRMENSLYSGHQARMHRWHSSWRVVEWVLPIGGAVVYFTHSGGTAPSRLT